MFPRWLVHCSGILMDTEIIGDAKIARKYMQVWDIFVNENTLTIKLKPVEVRISAIAQHYDRLRQMQEFCRVMVF